MDENPVYKDKADNRFEILRTRYVEQAGNLRDLNQYELKLLGGFLTIQLLLMSWFASHPVTGNWWRTAIIFVDFVLLVICLLMIWGARRRRRQITDTIWNINEAFGLYTPGIYHQDKAIDERGTAEELRLCRWLWRLLPAACVFIFICAVGSLFISP